MRKCRKFLGGLENPLIIYHKDSDGVCSAAQVAEYIGGTAHPNDGPGIELSEALSRMIEDSDEIVFLDLPVDQLDLSGKLASKKVFVLDHHPPERNMTEENILHVNPRFEDPDVYKPASYLSYQIAKDKLPGLAWKAGVGIIGDHGIDDCRDLIDEIQRQMPETVPEDRYNFEELKKSKLGTVSEMIEASKVVDGNSGIEKSLDILRSSESPDEVFKSGLLDYYNEYRNELESEVERFKDEARYFPKTDAHLYGVETRSSIGSNLANLMSDEKDDSVIIVYQKVGGGMKLSARCDSGRIDVSEILKDAVGGEGNAGGHPQAAGGFVRKGSEEVVLQRLRERLERID